MIICIDKNRIISLLQTKIVQTTPSYSDKQEEHIMSEKGAIDNEDLEDSVGDFNILHIQNFKNF